MNNNYSRRKFMKTVVVSAGAVGAGGLAGCGSGNETNYDEDDNSFEAISPSRSFDATVYPQSVASGDPRQDSIILWTRVSNGLSNQTVTVQVATDTNFSTVIAQADLLATYSSDHCVKVKVEGLESYTTYYYRFVTDGYPSRTGRFKSAPAYAEDRDIKFGFASCQDFRNGFYNSLLKFLEDDNDDIDFIAHLGDYIYETDGTNIRSVSFTDDSGAIDTGGDLAATTVAQYRDLYKTYRSDPALQRVHEKFAFVCIWDDHEFSDDAWGNVGTYFGGLVDEENTSRRENAEVAFFEYMPLDISPESGSLLSEGQVDVESEDVYPSTIYRKLRFGQRLDLVMTDYRTYRPDHLIPEDAFPGTVVMDNLATAQTLYAVPESPTSPNAFKATVDGALGAAISDITNPSALEQGTLSAVLAGTVTSGALPIFAYVDIDSVTDSTMANFLLSLNTAMTTLGVTPFSSGAAPTLKELLTYALTVAYQNPEVVDNPLGLADAAAKATANIDGNLDVISINGFLNLFYDGLRTTLNTSSAFLDSALTGAITVGLIGLGTDPATAAAQADAAAAATVASIDFTADEPYTQPSLTAVLTAVLTPSLGGAAGATATALTAELQLPYVDVDTMFEELSDLLVAQATGAGNAAAALFEFLDTDDAGTAKYVPTSAAGGLDDDWGFGGYCVSYAQMGKQSLSGIFGSRYLVVKQTYELFNLYHGLILQTANFGNAWGAAQQTGVLISVDTSTTDWNVLGSSVSFTSMILDANAGSTLDTVLTGAGVTADAFPRTAYFMNVDQWDGAPLTRATYMNDASGNLGSLGLGSFQDNNVVVISGDIHAAFITDHSENPEGTGRCLEFTVPGVSSESFGSFTAGAISTILDLAPADPRVTGLVAALSGFLDEGNAQNTSAPQDINYVNTSVNGVGIIELTSTEMTGSMYLLDANVPALLSNNEYDGASSDAEWSAATAAFTGNFTEVTRTSTKGANGGNGALT